MLKIKLTRIGKKNQPYYRIVITESRSKRNGKYVEALGTYNPLEKANIQINKNRFDFWVQRGAKPTNTVRRLYHKISSEKL